MVLCTTHFLYILNFLRYPKYFIIYQRQRMFSLLVLLYLCPCLAPRPQCCVLPVIKVFRCQIGFFVFLTRAVLFMKTYWSASSEQTTPLGGVRQNIIPLLIINVGSGQLILTEGDGAVGTGNYQNIWLPFTEFSHLDRWVVSFPHFFLLCRNYPGSFRRHSW